MMTAFLVSTLLFVAALVIIHWIHNQYELDIVIEPGSAPENGPLISICIPARNEAGNIKRCVEAALSQDYPRFEVIALDDRSSDATMEQLQELAARNPKLSVIAGAELPAGWAGKPHALFQAAKAARGEWLCFVDADTFLARQALSACYGKAIESNADLLTTMNEQVLGTFWEKVVMPLVMTALSVGFSPRKVNNPENRAAVANGQFILIRRSVYDAIGGHGQVRNEVVEDKALAEAVKWNGYRLIVADGSGVIQTRMYTSLESMWEGWTKNIYLGLRDQPGRLALGAFGALVALAAAVLLPVWTLAGVLWLRDGGGWMAGGVVLESLLVWAWMIHFRARVAGTMKISRWYALSTPIGAGVFAAMMLSSAWKVLSGQGVTWRGRKYHTSPRRYV